MKFNFFTTLIALCASALIGYGFYSFSHSDQKDLLAFGSFFFLFFTMLFTIGLRFSFYPRNLNIKAISIIFGSTFMVTHLVFAFVPFVIPAYVIINGLIFLLYVLSMYLVCRPYI